jgi:hypothetical protein
VCGISERVSETSADVPFSERLSEGSTGVPFPERVSEGSTGVSSSPLCLDELSSVTSVRGSAGREDLTAHTAKAFAAFALPHTPVQRRSEDSNIGHCITDAEDSSQSADHSSRHLSSRSDISHSAFISNLLRHILCHIQAKGLSARSEQLRRNFCGASSSQLSGTQANESNHSKLMSAFEGIDVSTEEESEAIQDVLALCLPAHRAGFQALLTNIVRRHREQQPINTYAGIAIGSREPCATPHALTWLSSISTQQSRTASGRPAPLVYERID